MFRVKLLDKILLNLQSPVYNQCAILLLPMDVTGFMRTSVWEEHFEKIQDDSFYRITNLKLRHLNWLVLSTQRFTEIIEIPSFEVKRNEFFFFLIRIHSMQCRTATTRHGVTKKRNTKRLSHTGNLFRKNLQLKDVC